MRRALGLMLFAGCASAPPGAERAFRGESFPRVSAAAAKALADHPDVRVETTRIEAGWGPERDLAREQGWLLDHHYKTRARYRIDLAPAPEGVLARVTATVERRAPGGVRALRWERVASDGRFEREILDAIEFQLRKP